MGYRVAFDSQPRDAQAYGLSLGPRAIYFLHCDQAGESNVRSLARSIDEESLTDELDFPPFFLTFLLLLFPLL